MTVAEPTTLTFAVALFTIANPIGTSPVFLGLTEKDDVAKQRRVARLVGLGALVVMLVGLFAGTAVLTFFGIDLTAFRIAGFAYVTTIAWAMMTHPNSIVASNGSSPAIVPLAFPIIAGPGVLTLMIAYAHDHHDTRGLVIGVIIAVVIAFLTTLTYSIAPLLLRLLHASGMNVFTRVFGLILLAICVQAFITSLAKAFPAWVS